MSDVHVAGFAELDVDTLYSLLKLRSDVFIVEQECVYADVDDFDQRATHVWIDDAVDGNRLRPVAYLRLLDDEATGTVRVGRVVVHQQWRGHGLAKQLMSAALTQIGARRAVLNAQTYAAELYREFGFEQTGPEFLDDGIPHIPMCRPPST